MMGKLELNLFVHYRILLQSLQVPQSLHDLNNICLILESVDCGIIKLLQFFPISKAFVATEAVKFASIIL